MGCSALEVFAVAPGNPVFATLDGVLFNQTAHTLTTYPPARTNTLYALPPGTLGIDDYAFLSCGKLESVTFPDGLTSIGASAFRYCSGLVRVTLPDGLATLGSNVFNGCTKLTSVGIPGTVALLGASAFSGCSALTNATFGAGVANIGNDAFNSCSKLVSAQIPNSVTNIGSRAFYGNGSLKNLVLGDGVATLGAEAFRNDYTLTSLVLPASLVFVGDQAFRNCSALSRMLFLGDAPTLGGASVFQYMPATVYYRPGAQNWPLSFGGRPAACWNPSPQAGAAFGFTSGGFGFTVVGNADIPVRIDFAEDLASENWTPLVNGTLGASGTLRVDDPASPDRPSRFYRIAFP